MKTERRGGGGGEQFEIIWEYNNPLITSRDDRLALSVLVWEEGRRRRMLEDDEEGWGEKQQKKKKEKKWKTAMPPWGRVIIYLRKR